MTARLVGEEGLNMKEGEVHVVEGALEDNEDSHNPEKRSIFTQLRDSMRREHEKKEGRRCGMW